MSIRQYIAIGLCFSLLVIVYLFVGTNKPAGTQKEPINARKNIEGSFDFNAYLKQRREGIPADTLKLFDSMTDSVENAKKPAEKLYTLRHIVNLYAISGMLDLAAYYQDQAAQISDSIKDWRVSGDLNYRAALFNEQNENAKAWFIDKAIQGFSHCIERDSQNLDYRIRLAECYMDGTSQAMSGVQILLDVVRKDSNNADAQFTLGRYGIVSGQYEKAIARLEKVLYLQPQNADAYILLAEAYEKNGQADKAIGKLEKGVRLQEDPEMKKAIESHIRELKAAGQP